MESQEGRAFGRYRVRRELGKGAMGSVFLAHDELLGRDVAIKTIASAQSGAAETARARFMHEARAIATLSHPNVVNVFDAGVESETPYLVMEVVSGPSLKDRIAEAVLLPWEVCALGIQIAQALQEAHDAGIVHRDVKPANILQFRPGQWKLGDFGVAKIPDSSLTLAGQFLGTPAYAAPETLTEGEFSTASDVYALAATLFEAAAGKPPLPRSPQLRVAAIASGEGPTPLADLAPHAPPELGEALARGLRASSAERPSATELAGALAAVSAHTERPVAPARDDSDATEFVASEGGGAARRAAAAGEPGRRDARAGDSDAQPATGPERGDRRRGRRGAAAGGALVLAAGAAAVAFVALGDPEPDAAATANGDEAGAATEDERQSGASSGRGPESSPWTGEDDRPRPQPAAAAEGDGEERDEEDLRDEGGEEDPRDGDARTGAAEAGRDAASASGAEATAPPEPAEGVPGLADLRARVEAGRTGDRTLHALEDLGQDHPDLAEIPYLKGRLYFSRMWWSHGFPEFEAALALDERYRYDEGLIADLIEAMKGSRRHRAREFLTREIGEPAIPQLRDALDRRSRRITQGARAALERLGAD